MPQGKQPLVDGRRPLLGDMGAPTEYRHPVVAQYSLAQAVCAILKRGRASRDPSEPKGGWW